ncbi:hypothetical protein DL764_002366 [Monosporascus ibericus]|uniref:Uncharacterized protein n=1 Tax=Monosporascus ibericus TaxID=155417 RepID=A0A4Q4TKP8_9PEZI|nr:hypothetical protein DL764_002366 [Monosporascus ibericus]
MQLQKDYDQDAHSTADEGPGGHIERQIGRLIRIEELKGQCGNQGDADRFVNRGGGDAVHVLLGADVPFLLRQKNMCGLCGLDGSWSLVGEPYVEGLMVGEAVRAIGKPSEELDDVILR